MTSLPPLADLGPRICILGPSNSGKSTLAVAISEKTDIPVVHLDQLHHQPNTHWKPREQSEFQRLHTNAIHQTEWVMEGNYIGLFDERVAQATGVILLDISTPVSLFRYLKRCYSKKPRQGGLEGADDHVTLDMIKYIVVESPRKRRIHRERVKMLTLPKVFLDTPEQLNNALKKWQL